MDPRVLFSSVVFIVFVAALFPVLYSFVLDAIWVVASFVVPTKVVIHMIAMLPTLETGGQFLFNRESPLFYNESRPYAGVDAVFVHRFTWNVEQALSTSADSPSAGSAKGLDVYREADVHSPLLIHVSASGTLIERVVLFVAPNSRGSSDLGDYQSNIEDNLAIYTFTGVTIKTIHHSTQYSDHVLEHLNLQYGAVQVEWSPRKDKKKNKMDDGTVVAVRYWNGTGAPPDPKRTEIFEHNGAKVKVGINKWSKTPCAGSAYLPNKPNNWRSLVRIWLDGH